MTRPPRQAFTIVETLVVMAIVALVIALAVPAIQHARAAMDKLQCKNNLRQLGIAFHNRQATRGTFIAVAKSIDDVEVLYLSWLIHALPELEGESRYSQYLSDIAISRNVYANPPHRGLSTVINLFLCPSDPRLNTPLTDPFNVTAA